MPFPSPPWRMQGQLWLSLFRVPDTGRVDRPGGVYGVGLVDYQEGSVLTYHELLVARTVDRPGKPVSISDIWVDSAASRAGGRALWAIPKELAEFSLSSTDGVVCRTSGEIRDEDGLIATASFTDTSRLAVRTPFSGSTWQPRDDGGSPATSQMRGSARSMPCRGSWEFAPDGPLGWLHGRRPLLSARMRDFKMAFDE